MVLDNFLILVLVCASFFVGWFQFQLIDKLVSLQTENEKLEERINSLEQVPNHHATVAVHVRLSGAFPLTGTARVMYDVEITNIGKAFNFQKGYLIAPVSGVYLLHVTACLGSGGQWMDLNIMENDKLIGRVFTGDNSYHACGSEALSVHLGVGAIVWVQRADGTSTKLNQDHGWNSFTAVLVKAD